MKWAIFPDFHRIGRHLNYALQRSIPIKNQGRSVKMLVNCFASYTRCKRAISWSIFQSVIGRYILGRSEEPISIIGSLNLVTPIIVLFSGSKRFHTHTSRWELCVALLGVSFKCRNMRKSSVLRYFSECSAHNNGTKVNGVSL